MTATNYGDSGFGPRTADSLGAAGESRAPSLHCLLLAWDSGEFGKCVFDLRPCGVAACGEWCETQLGHVLTALPAPAVQSLGPCAPFAHCMCCPLDGPWTLNLGLPCACLERPAEGPWALCGSSTCTGSSLLWSRSVRLSPQGAGLFRRWGRVLSGCYPVSREGLGSS